MLRGTVAVLLGYVTALMLLALTYTGFAKWRMVKKLEVIKDAACVSSRYRETPSQRFH